MPEKDQHFATSKKMSPSYSSLLIYLLGLTRRRFFEIEALNPEKKRSTFPKQVET